MMVAALGVLYINASSPKLPRLWYEPTNLAAPSVLTYMSKVPLKRTPRELNSRLRRAAGRYTCCFVVPITVHLENVAL